MFLKTLYLIIFLLLPLSSWGQEEVKTLQEELQTEHYLRSGAIPEDEVQNILFSNYKQKKIEVTFKNKRSIASEIQHMHVIRIKNTPLKVN